VARAAFSGLSVSSLIVPIEPVLAGIGAGDGGAG
jgi:hypothetical protein